MNVLAILESDIMKNLIEDVLMDETAVQNVKVIKPNSDLHFIKRLNSLLLFLTSITITLI